MANQLSVIAILRANWHVHAENVVRVEAVEPAEGDR